MTAADAITEQVNRMTAVNDALYAAVANNSAQDIRDRVDQWHDQALTWQNMGALVLTSPTEVVTDQTTGTSHTFDRANAWGTLGKQLAANARDIAYDANAEETTTALIAHFIEGMPGAIVAVSKNAITGAANAVKFVARTAAETGKAVAKDAAGLAGAAALDALKVVPWPIWAALGVVGATLLYIVVKHSGEIVGAASKAVAAP